MNNYEIYKADFITSAGIDANYPPYTCAEIAMVGKSNVGKSSLINSLCNRRKLAKTSQTPGKTRLINFFDINEGEFKLVDLPGYGFAKVSKQMKQQWQQSLETYLSSSRVTHVIMLIDIRHNPTQEDKMMFDWILYYNLPFTIVATKADKLPKTKRVPQANAAAKNLGTSYKPIVFSSESKQGREELLNRIKAIVDDYNELNAAIQDDN